MTRVLFFDTFGTLVDWRTGILDAFADAGRRTGLDADWSALTDDWRRAYPGAMLAARQQPTWRNLDALQAETLDDVLAGHSVHLPASERAQLVLSWRELPPWPDTRHGLHRLRTTYCTATLSNGHVALLVDLMRFGDLTVDAVLSAELAGSYKPDPAVYRRAAELLECPLEEAAMVAAHGSDLAAAAELGMRPVFVRRPLEWGPDAGPVEVPDLPGLVVVDALEEILGALD